MSKTTKEERFFSPPHHSRQQFSRPALAIIHFRHNALLGFSALIIDYFMTAPSQKFNASAERLLANLDLLKVYPHYPFSQTSPQPYLSSANYLHQLCSAATTPTLLLWLMRSISLALKRLSFEEMTRHEDYYNFVYGETFHIQQLQSEDPNQINRYMSFVLQRVLGFEFMQSETYDNKKLPKTFYVSKPKASATGLIIHWEKGQCLCSAMIEHSALFKPLMSHENTHFLHQELQNYQPILAVNKDTHPNNRYVERYALAKNTFSQLQLSLDDLVKFYSDTLDMIFEIGHHQHRLLFLESRKSYTRCSNKNRGDYQSQSLSARLYEALQELLCRLIALEAIPEKILLNQPTSSKEKQCKTFLT